MLRRTPLRRTGRLNPVSPRRRRENRRYTTLRAAYLEGHPFCEFPLGCTAPATTIQHLRGRRGARLVDVDWWKASCLACNLWAESNTGRALEIGWLVRIEGAA